MKAFDKLLAKVLTEQRLERMGLIHRSHVSDKELSLILTDDRLNLLNLRVKTEDDEHEKIPLIEFFCPEEDWEVIPKPVPALKRIPEWFRKIPAEHKVEDRPERDAFGAPAMTAKKCLPLLDGMGVGYIMTTFADMNVRTHENGKLIEHHNPPVAHAASYHGVNQLGGIHSPTGNRPAIKFHNRWVIQTRPGVSTLFIPPINHIEERFTCLGAMVDTDTYPKQVNFPAIWHANSYDGVVTANTPLVTAIPIRRKDVDMDAVIRAMKAVEADTIKRMERIQGTRSHYYTKELRDPRK